MQYRILNVIQLSLLGIITVGLLSCNLPSIQDKTKTMQPDSNDQQLSEDTNSNGLTFQKLWTFFKNRDRSPISVLDPLNQPNKDLNKVYVHAPLAGLYALDLKTGQEIWHFKTCGGSGYSIAANEKVVCVGGWDFYAVNAEDGTLLWSIPSGEACDSWNHPLIVGETLYLAQGGQIQSTGQDFLHALELETGKSKWKYQVSALIIGPPAIGNGLVYFGSLDGWFYALDEMTGKERWKTQLPYWIDSQPAVDSEKVYFQTKDIAIDKVTYKVFALDAFTGKEQWSFNTIGNNTINVPPVVYQGMLYIAGGPLYAIDTQTGKEVWSHPSRGKIPFAIANDQVYIGGDALYVLDPKTGSTIKVFHQDIFSPATHILLNQDIIIFGDDFGALYAIQEK